MSEQLTALERALLKQFETLAGACSTALKNTESVSEGLQTFESDVKVRFDQVERMQKGIEQRLRSLSAALDEQTRLTEAWKERSESLVTQVNALLAERKK